VIRTRVGYAGGTKKNPTYHGLGDHAETIQIDYDPAKISYEGLLDIFWEDHDPTYPRLSRQYMSAIFYHDREQNKLAVESKDRETNKLKSTIYTEIVPYTEFYIAEDYHQKYALQRNSELMREFGIMYPSFDGIVSSTAAARANGYLGGYGNLRDLEAEINSYSFSEASKIQLLSVMKGSHHILCKR
jgi:peptide-methionine (S)-S-oxide reductase